MEYDKMVSFVWLGYLNITFKHTHTHTHTNKVIRLDTIITVFAVCILYMVFVLYCISYWMLSSVVVEIYVSSYRIIVSKSKKMNISIYEKAYYDRE